MDQEFFSLAESINGSASTGQPSQFNSQHDKWIYAYRSAVFEIERNKYNPTNWFLLGKLFVKGCIDFWLAELSEETADHDDSVSSSFRRYRYVIKVLELACSGGSEISEAIELAREKKILLVYGLKGVNQSICELSDRDNAVPFTPP